VVLKLVDFSLLTQVVKNDEAFVRDGITQFIDWYRTYHRNQ